MQGSKQKSKKPEHISAIILKSSIIFSALAVFGHEGNVSQKQIRSHRFVTLQEHQKTLTWLKVSDKGHKDFIIVVHGKKIFGMMVQN